MYYETQTQSSPSLDKTTIMKTFNKHFFDFMDDVITIFPENMDLETARNSFETFKKANPTTLIKVWHKYVYTQYHDYIEQGDISYFLDKDYSNDVRNVSNQSKTLDAINRLRDPLKNMGEKNKAHAVKYIQNLCKLCHMYEEAGGIS